MAVVAEPEPAEGFDPQIRRRHRRRLRLHGERCFWLLVGDFLGGVLLKVDAVPLVWRAVARRLAGSALQPPFDPERLPLLDTAADCLLRWQEQATSSELAGQLCVPTASQNLGGDEGRHAVRPLASRL